MMGKMALVFSAFFIPWSSEKSISTSVPAVVSKLDVANAVNSFGYELMLNMLNDTENYNTIISPTSIVGLMAMTLLGSVGKSYEEIAKSLGFSQDILHNRKIHESFGELLNQLNANVSSKTLYADAIFVHRNTEVRELYRRYLKNVYHGDTLSTDFRQAEQAKSAINEWVKNHTEGHIENFIKKPLSTVTKLVLLSALYFNGQWKQPFQPEHITKLQFKKTTHYEILTDFMYNYGQFDYIFSEIDGLHMLALPYNDSTTTMYALKPRLPRRLSLTDLMARLDYNKIDNLINQMTKKACVVRFPKMKLTNAVSLENTLKNMGLRSIFTPGEANFALMVNNNMIINKTEDELVTRLQSDEVESRSLKEMVDSLPNPGIYVDSILHEVKMDINEYGTEAVAATGALLSRTSEQFYADSPFYIFVRNENTKLVTFSAIIFDPTV